MHYFLSFLTYNKFGCASFLIQIKFKPACVVLVSFGTVNYKLLPISRMIEHVFAQFTQCYFYVRTDIPSQYDNVYTTEDLLPQKQILCIYLFNYYLTNLPYFLY
ncbi:unnamed protein product [Meloidogyne enterolobii]|uniref:Uncharacterized protein n=1 Tax=Meloidogyne enterolobii TaxID=390850 RepID=A0ACB0Z0H0_MELEN